MESVILNRTGRWYLTVMNITVDSIVDSDIIGSKEIPRDKIIKFEDKYGIRTWTSGCYFYDEKTKSWHSSGMEIRQTKYSATYCRSDHLTAFGTGFFVVPSEIDFDYVFANASFEDNLTLYMAIIITLILYILLSTWAR